MIWFTKKIDNILNKENNNIFSETNLLNNNKPSTEELYHNFFQEYKILFQEEKDEELKNNEECNKELKNNNLEYNDLIKLEKDKINLLNKKLDLISDTENYENIQKDYKLCIKQNEFIKEKISENKIIYSNKLNVIKNEINSIKNNLNEFKINDINIYENKTEIIDNLKKMLTKIFNKIKNDNNTIKKEKIILTKKGSLNIKNPFKKNNNETNNKDKKNINNELIIEEGGLKINTKNYI